MYSWTTADTVNTNSMAAARKRFSDICRDNSRENRQVKTTVLKRLNLLYVFSLEIDVFNGLSH